MTIKIYNTLSRQKQEFIPLKEGEVSMYVCGPTVYNFIHIGNARTFIVFDTIRRYFEYRGYKVNYVQNFTDIDDKMINRANLENITVKELGDKYIDEYIKDSNMLGIKKATFNPRATEMINDIIEFIQALEQKGYAYNVDGNVYFNTKSFKQYGKLSHQSLDDLEAGARIEINESKKDPMDFALWKKQKINEPAWESPWGLGRPGWHIECSVMSTKILGDTIDIHAGGADLVFPHHENEVAQSEAKTGKAFSNYWMHAAFLNINNQKMSKSLNNFHTAREVLEKYDAEVIRLFMISGHYRTPLNFSFELLEQSVAALERLYNSIKNLEYYLEISKEEELKKEEEEYYLKIDSYKNKFIEVMDDDFNTADGISVLFELVKDININITSISSRKLINKAIDMIKELGEPLGILKKNKDEEIDENIKNLIEQRQMARKERNFALADKIRDELKEKGYLLEDTKDGVKVSIKK